MKSNLINATRTFNSLTANGALTHSTSTNYCLDLFFIAGASRNFEESHIIMMWERARGENVDLAYRILFWARDCRGGAGEKRFFHVIAKHANLNSPEQWEKVSTLTPLYGYWKDYFVVESINDDTLNFLYIQLEESENANLLAKWFPRKGEWFKAMHNYLSITPKQLRKKLVDLTNVVETKLCNREWNSIDYSKVPSIAMNLYRITFVRHDLDRFTAFNQLVLEGEVKVNASVLHPHQLFQAMCEGENAEAIEAQWINLTNYMEGSTERILPLCDVSASMTGLPMDVSVSLGLYIAERNEGPFKNAFMTFSEKPEMNYIQEGTLKDKLAQIKDSNWGYCTNLEASFELILNSALREGLSEDEMPTKLLIISDMEFNEAQEEKTNLESIRTKYADSGYVMPEIIFWNVNGRMDNMPAMDNEPGVGLVSGFSPAILTSILKGKVLTPYDLMHKTVMDSRYEPVTTMLEL